MPHRRSLVPLLALAALVGLHLPACGAGEKASGLDRQHTSNDARDKDLDWSRGTGQDKDVFGIRVIAIPAVVMPEADSEVAKTITFFNAGSPMLVTGFVIGYWTEMDSSGDAGPGEINPSDPRADHTKLIHQSCPNGTLLKHGESCTVTVKFSGADVHNAIGLMNGANQVASARLIKPIGP